MYYVGYIINKFIDIKNYNKLKYCCGKNYIHQILYKIAKSYNNNNVINYNEIYEQIIFVNYVIIKSSVDILFLFSKYSSKFSLTSLLTLNFV